MAENVIDMGTFGPQNPNPLGEGLMVGAEALAQGAKDRANITLKAAQIKNQQTLYKNRLQVTLAKMQESEDKTHHDNTVKALEQTSLYLSDKNQQEQDMFKSTPHYKEIQKLAKSYAPEYIDDKGGVILPEPKGIYTDALDKQKFQLQQKIASGTKLTDGEQKLSDFLQKTDTSLIGSALHSATTDPQFKADPQGTMKQYVQAAIQGKKQMQDGGQSLQQTQSPLSGAIAGGDGTKDPNDPLGILKYLKPGNN